MEIQLWSTGVFSLTSPVSLTPLWCSRFSHETKQGAQAENHLMEEKKKKKQEEKKKKDAAQKKVCVCVGPVMSVQQDGDVAPSSTPPSTLPRSRVSMCVISFCSMS